MQAIHPLHTAKPNHRLQAGSFLQVPPSSLRVALLARAAIRTPPMNCRLVSPFLFAALLAPFASAAERLVVTVSHDLSIARPSETITVPWTEVNRALPGALLQHLAVKDAAGHVLAYQVTNIAPLAKDPDKKGVAYGELIFQYDFAAGEKSATFTVEQTDEVAPVFPVKAFARFVPERLDDFAWENDRIAHRIYGPALAAPSEPPGAKEVLVTSGVDVWCKRVRYPIVDRWYNKGHDHYHTDEGEGLDMYAVGTSRGCGGTGVWDGTRLHVSRNFKTARVLANGPVRAVFELSYDTWAAGGVFVSETKRFTVDAGHNLDCIESTFVFVGAPEITVAIGLGKHGAAAGAVTRNTTAGWLGLWEKYPKAAEAELGTGVVLPSGLLAGFAEDEANHLALVKVRPGQTIRYHPGAGWTRSGDFTGEADWNDYLAACAARIAAPLTVTCGAGR